MGYSIETRCLHLEENEAKSDVYGAVSFPIYQTATFAHKGVGQSTGYDYSRLQNPTREQLEKIVASLEKGVDALAFASGMAAIATLMELFEPGDHLVVDADLYGGSIRLFQNISEKNGIRKRTTFLKSAGFHCYVFGRMAAASEKRSRRHCNQHSKSVLTQKKHTFR